MHRALRMLERDGYMEQIPRRGWRMVAVTSGEIDDLFDVREMLELRAIPLAVARVPPSHWDGVIRRTADALRAMEAGRPVPSVLALEDALHGELARRSGNRFLAQAFEMFGRRLLRMAQAVGYGHTRAGPAALRFHLQILRALRRRSVREASRTMRAHLRYGRVFMRRAWRGGGTA